MPAFRLHQRPGNRRLAPHRRLAWIPVLLLGIVLIAGCGPDVEHQAPAAQSAGIHAEPAAHQAEDSHDAHAVSGLALPTPPATPWPSDAPLREGMRRMHQAVAALEHAEHGHLDAAQAAAAAQLVQDAANDMIANCKLAPEPDAALHGLLVALLGGAAAIKADPADTTPVAAMREALALYPRMFDDPGWAADTAPAK